MFLKQNVNFVQGVQQHTKFSNGKKNVVRDVERVNILVDVRT